MLTHSKQTVSQGLNMRAAFKRLRSGKDHRNLTSEQSVVLRDTADHQVHIPVNFPTSLMDSQDAEKYGLLAVAVPKNSEIDTVIIHGLRGHRRNTWTKRTDTGNCF